MKKCLLSISLSSIFLLTGCGNNANIGEEIIDSGNKIAQEINSNPTLEDTIIDYITTNYDCKDGSKLFVNYAKLGMKSLGNGVAERYIIVNAEGFYIDERGNLNNSCGFGIPMKITLSTEDGTNYVVTDAVQARDGNEYDKSIKEMFSDEAIDRLYNGNYEFWDGRTLLEMAEEYFGITIIPETKNNFECRFCDKLWYYEPLKNDEGKNNELIYNYISENNGNNTIYFGSDGKFRAEGSWDAGTGTRTFGKDENIIIVLNNNIEHVYDRYIITNQTENSLNTVLEIIQRM